MRVLQVTPTFYPEVGGIETVVDELTNQLGLHQIETEIAHVSVAHKNYHEEVIAGKRVWRVPMFGNRLVGVAPQLRGLIKGFDLIHVHDPQLAALTANVALFRGDKAAVLSTHGGYHHTKRFAFWKRAHEKILMRSALKVYSGVLASSQADYSRFQKYSNRIVLCPNGVNVGRFQIPEKASYDTRKWIYWGRLSKNKRLDRVIACVSQARELGFEVNLCICGPDFDGISDELKAQIAAEGLTKCIQIKPFLAAESLRDELATRVVFITASEHEGFGLSIIEAMAAGCVILCRDIEPLNGFIKQGTNGLFLNFDGKGDDAVQLTRLLQMNEAQVATSSGASQQFATAYDWHHAVTNFVKSYRSVLDCKLRS
jgi:alpha-1,3-mannosyltransferase